ncbi:hypothetical protein RvY_15334 [Ramazzottius varieornatus]|uniref:Uncharacterized protein n=1 Tax=Ramazzottius varieornatus TaxID=947166 RepID=A0A1D1VUJ1_RAMVA|nr:hypothetical protein RvY_15334 [Ramazzottius varieornatus]
MRSGLGMIADVLYVEEYDGWFGNRTVKRYDPTVKYEKEDFQLNLPNTKPDAVYDMSKYPSNASWAGQPNFKETCNKDLIRTSTTPVTKVATKVATKVVSTPSTPVTKVATKLTTKLATKVVTTPSTPVTAKKKALGG